MGTRGRTVTNICCPLRPALDPRAPVCHPCKGQGYRQHCDHTKDSAEDSTGSMQYAGRITEMTAVRPDCLGSNPAHHGSGSCFLTCLCTSFLKHHNMYLSHRAVRQIKWANMCQVLAEHQVNTQHMVSTNCFLHYFHKHFIQSSENHAGRKWASKRLSYYYYS